uniref:Alpha-ketoglutarate dehydrogenase subunit 4 n=2 Tax=Sus scrofa TaxID=9823 RepID=A0A8D2A7W3_PIG
MEVCFQAKGPIRATSASLRHSHSNMGSKPFKPHTPLIRFPDRRDNPKPNVSEVLRSAALPSHPSISQHSKGSKSPDWLKHQGPPDTAEIIKTLPQKYRRKLVSQEEMEFIQRGGPE